MSLETRTGFGSQEQIAFLKDARTTNRRNEPRIRVAYDDSFLLLSPHIQNALAIYYGAGKASADTIHPYVQLESEEPIAAYDAETILFRQMQNIWDALPSKKNQYNLDQLAKPKTYTEYSYDEVHSSYFNLNTAPQGTVIHDIPFIEAIDALIWDAESKTRPDNLKIKWSPVIPKTFVKYTEELFREKKFNGKIEDIKLITLDPDVSSQLTNRGVELDGTRFNFLTSLVLSSTGRNIIGTLITHSSFAWKIYENEKTGLQLAFFGRHRQLSGTQGVDIFDELQQTSLRSWEKSQREALRNVVSAGLPSLGKKR